MVSEAKAQALIEVLTPNFQKEAIGGFFCLDDRKEGIVQIGWIQRIEIKDCRAIITSTILAEKEKNKTKWNFSTDFVFRIDDLGRVVAIPQNGGGLNCLNVNSQSGIFLFPRSAVPPNYTRDFIGLVKLGNDFAR